MASETKRQNVGNKTPVALPNSTPTQPAANTVSLEAALTGAIGARIRVTTVAPVSSTIEGILFTADPITNLVAINTSSNAPVSATATSSTFPGGSYRLIPISQITSFNLLSPPSPANTSFSTALPALHALDVNALRAREAAAIRAAHAARARLGPKGTTKEHQDIFDAIARTHPAKWQANGSILVNDSILIDKPYQPENCKLAPGGSGPVGGVERIKKVLKMEREKLELKAARFDVGKANLKDGGVRKGG